MLLKRHSQTVISIVRRHVPPDHVEEVAHEVFIRAFKSLPGLKKRDRFKQWVSSIASKTCCDFWRKRYRSKETPLSSFTRRHKDWLDNVLAEDANRNFQEMCARKEARELLDWGLAQLSPKDRMVIEMVYLEGLTGKEASRLLGLSHANVKVRCFRAKKKLEKCILGADCGK